MQIEGLEENAFKELATYVYPANAGEEGSGDSKITCYAHFFVNVTNASTFQVKFLTTSMGSGSFLMGDTAQNFTTFSFVRLGDSQ